MRKTKDITGQKFYSLSVISFLGTKNKHAMFLCVCDCGKEVMVEGHRLRSGNKKSCGCKNSEYLSEAKKTHGMTNTRLYRIWHSMRFRCKETKGKINNRYCYNQGITYCDEWERFEPFMEWALKSGYRDDLSLDRINTNGNYEPNNCRWADKYTQANNKKTSVFYEILGVKHTIAEWSRITGIPETTLSQRYKAGKKDLALIKGGNMRWMNAEPLKNCVSSL